MYVSDRKRVVQNAEKNCTIRFHFIMVGMDCVWTNVKRYARMTLESQEEKRT